MDYALHAEKEQARLRRDYYQGVCHAFEGKHNISSDEFLTRFEAGQLGDDATYFDWYAAKRGFDLWERRYSILSEVSV
jgi:hypothetical protein